MQQYIIRGGNGFVRELFCHRAEAIAAWKRIGGNTKLFVLKDGHEFTVVVNDKPPQTFKTNPFADKFREGFNNLFKPTEPKIEETSIPPAEEPEVHEQTSEYHVPVRSWFATPSY